MTRDEVLAMSDEELRYKVASLLGAKGFGQRTDHEGTHLTAYWLDSSHKQRIDDTNFYLGGWEDIPDYPNDIAAAWELIHRIKEIDSVKQFWFGQNLLVLTNTYNFLDGLTQTLLNMDARTITRAFVWTMSCSEEADD